MADNYAATQGAGTTFAADDVGGVLYPRLKLALGADGAADMDLDSGQQTMANSVPVALASDQDFVKAEDAAHGSGDKGIMLLAVRKDTAAALATTDADYIPLIVDASGRLHIAPLVAGSAAIGKLAANSGVDIGDVDVLSIAAGSNVIGKVGIDQTTPGTTNLVQLAAGSAAVGKLAANSGVDIGDVDVTSLSALEATTPTEYNITLTNANTEYSQALPANTRALCFRCRTGVQVRYAWVTGKVAAPTANYQTLVAGAEYVRTGVKLAAATLYWASATAGAIVELECWNT